MDCSPGTDVVRLCEVLLYHFMNGDRGVWQVLNSGTCGTVGI